MKKRLQSTDILRHSAPSPDVNGGFLCMWTYWRPDLSATDPDMPGLKQQLITYLPVKPQQVCLCGSGQPHSRCCRLHLYWHPLCPNFALQGYSLLAPQEIICDQVDGDKIRAQLNDDIRFHCVEDTAKRAFWTLWGNPALESPSYGINCFGDIELQHNRKLVVTALSDNRKAILMDILVRTLGLVVSGVMRNTIHGIDKQTGKKCKIPATFVS